MKTIFNRSGQKEVRQELRKHMPKPEQILWLHLKGSGLGVKFRRQHGIGPFVVDFYCPEKHVAIELDGDSHFVPEAVVYDSAREEYMNRLGIRTLRFLNTEVHENLEDVLVRIRTAIETANPS